MRHPLTALALAALAGGSQASAAAPPPSWPPATAPGELFAHIGEEHLTDADGPRVLPAVVAELVKYRPLAVMTSADKSDDGTEKKLEDYKQAVIVPLAGGGIPVFSATGNHDRTAPPPVPGGAPGVVAARAYPSVFADPPFPWGDAAPVATPPFAPLTRPAGDPDGASNHFVVDIGAARWIFVDNSCYEIRGCDLFQNPPFPDAEGFRGQFEWMTAKAAEAKRQGRRAFVVMHMPTRDDRPGHTEPTPGPHTMGEGFSTDNATFERRAAAAGLDGVFLGHVKVMQQYVAGGVPFFTDGGAGGELHVNEQEKVGVDSGYWYGYRLVRVAGRGITTDAVPVIVPGGITVTGPARVARGALAAFTATARSPATEGVRVDTLELRDPDPARPNASKLPSPARIWTSGDPLVLAPVAAADDDPRRDAATQTDSGRFAARCPGPAAITVTAGSESRTAAVTVPSEPGPIVRSVERRSRTVRRGRTPKLAAVRLVQPARLIVRVTRGGKTVGSLAERCTAARKRIAVRWDGRLGGRAVPRGRYGVTVRVASDRPSVVRRYAVRVRWRPSRSARGTRLAHPRVGLRASCSRRSSSPTGARSRSASRARAVRWASRRSPSTPRPTVRRCTSAPPTRRTCSGRPRPP